jgi:hypothetical protein
VSGVVDTMIATKELVETDGYLRPA